MLRLSLFISNLSIKVIKGCIKHRCMAEFRTRLTYWSKICSCKSVVFSAAMASINTTPSRNDRLEKRRRIMAANFAEIHVIVESEELGRIGTLCNPTGKVDMWTFWPASVNKKQKAMLMMICWYIFFTLLSLSSDWLLYSVATTVHLCLVNQRWTKHDSIPLLRNRWIYFNKSS